MRGLGNKVMPVECLAPCLAWGRVQRVFTMLVITPQNYLLQNVCPATVLYKDPCRRCGVHPTQY